jgi:hypothetical protein
MEHYAGKVDQSQIRLGDKVLSSDGGKTIDSVCLNYGYMLPDYDNQGCQVFKTIMGDTYRVFLSKEEVLEMFLHFKNKGVYAHLDIAP